MIQLVVGAAAASERQIRYPAETARLDAESPILDYQPPTVPKPSRVALTLSNAIFALTALAFVPLHALVGRNIAIALVSILAFAIGAVLATRSLSRGPRRQAVQALSVNALGLFFVTAYLVYFWTALEPLSMLGK